MSKEILVSICVPVYGVEKYIQRCAVSLFEQTYNNIEYVFINDCTKDKSIEVLMETLEHYPNRKSQVSIIKHQHNKGLAGARNTGVQHATGEFILWVDSDDSINVTTVEKLVELQKTKDSDIVCCDSLVHFPRYKTSYRNIDYVDGKDLSLKMIQDIAPHQLWGHLIRRSLYIDNGITAVEGINQGEDWHVMPRLAYYANKVDTLHEALYYYDMTSVNSYSNNLTSNTITEHNMAHSVLNSFFADKEIVFKSSLREKYLRDLVSLISLASHLDDNELLNQLQKECDKFTIIEKNKLSIHKQIFVTVKNKYILRVLSSIKFYSYNKWMQIKEHKSNKSVN